MSDDILGVAGENRPSDDARPTVVPARDSEHRLIARLAKRKEWIIPDDVFKSAPKVMQEVVENSLAESRERIQAARTLVMMQNANTGQQSVDVRVNQQIAIEVAPVVPSDVDVDVQPAWAEDVNTDQMDATIAAMEDNGILSRYIDQVKTSATPLPSNGNGHPH